MAYAVEYSDSQSPLTLTSQLSEAEKGDIFFSKCADRMREKQKSELKNNFPVLGNMLILQFCE